MWLENLKDLRKEKGNPTSKRIAEEAKLPERTVNRIFAGETDCPKADTLYKIVNALGGSLDDILADTKVVLGTECMAVLQENVNELSAERDSILSENASLREEIVRLTTENALLTQRVQYQEEIINLHNYYRNLLSAKG